MRTALLLASTVLGLLWGFSAAKLLELWLAASAAFVILWGIWRSGR